MSEIKVLVVDDEADVLDLVGTILQREGYRVVRASDGRSALAAVSEFEPDVVVLDVMLPNGDGLSVCREIRATRNTPVLMISARGDDVDKIVGLEVGADDYLSKPFNPRELVARVRAMVRRLGMTITPESQAVLVRHDVKIYSAGQRVEVAGQEVHLTPVEFSLLKALVAHAGLTLSRQDILNRVWGPDYFGDERTVDTHVRNVRAKLQAAVPNRHYITSVWGVGYKFEG